MVLWGGNAYSVHIGRRGGGPNERGTAMGDTERRAQATWDQATRRAERHRRAEHYRKACQNAHTWALRTAERNHRRRGLRALLPA